MQEAEEADKAAAAVMDPLPEAFRESFLFVLDPVEASAFRRFGEVLHDLLLDRAEYAERNPQCSFTLAELLAVLSDLRFLERFLGQVGTERFLSDLSATDRSLSLTAERLGSEIGALVRRLEQEIELLIADDEGDPGEESPVHGK